jgi:hypothetical protein
MAMNGYYGYQLYQGERDRTRAEIMDADLRLGQLAATASRLARRLRRGLSRDRRVRLSPRLVWPDRVQEDS